MPIDEVAQIVASQRRIVIGLPSAPFGAAHSSQRKLLPRMNSYTRRTNAASAA